MSDSAADYEQLIAEAERHLPKRIRLTMLNLVMAWARVDTAIAQLASTAFAMDPTVGAVIFGKMRVADRLGKTRELNLQLGRLDAAKSLRELKKIYEKHSHPRNLIAHATCIGMAKDKPERLIFMPFEAQGTYGNLAVEVLPFDLIVSAGTWALKLEEEIHGMLVATEFWKSSEGDTFSPGNVERAEEV